jgi:hypothetical protein
MLTQFYHMIDSVRQKYDATCIINAKLHINDVKAMNFFLFVCTVQSNIVFLLFS